MIKHKLEWPDLKGKETGVLIYQLLSIVVVPGDINSLSTSVLTMMRQAHTHIQRQPSGRVIGVCKKKALERINALM